VISDTQAPAARQLLSDRFRYTPGQKELGAAQDRLINEFLGRVADGRYQLVHSPCACGRPPRDVVIAEVDRFGLPVANVLCLRCGTVRIDPYLDPPSLADFYRTLYQDLYGRAPDPGEYFDRQRVYGRKVLVAIVEGLRLRPGTVLEVGCGAGGALLEFRDAGWSVTGCDYSDRLLKFGTSRGVPDLHGGSIFEVSRRLGGNRFDLVLLHHVFEHIDRPYEAFRTLAELLAPEGRLLLIVPYLRGIHTHPFPAGDALGYLHIAHKYNYSLLGLVLSARQAGLRVDQVRPPTGMPTAWSHGPELWVVVTAGRGTVPTASSMADEPGRAMLRYLRATERLYRWGICPRQLADQAQRFTPNRIARAALRRLGLGHRRG
jgi:SAM-dependent methyltransferase